MKNYLKKPYLINFLLAFFFSSSLFLQGCLNDDDFKETPLAYVSFYHGAPDVGATNIFVDNRPMSERSFEFNNFTGYLNFFVGHRNIRVTPINGSTSIIDTAFTFRENKFYSLLAADTLSKVKLILVEDSLVAPKENKVGIRIIHLSPDAASVNVDTTATNGSFLFEQVDFKEATEFKEINAGKYTFNIREAGGESTLLTLEDVTLTAGRIYTIVVRGYQNPPSGNLNILSGQLLVNYYQ